MTVVTFFSLVYHCISWRKFRATVVRIILWAPVTHHLSFFCNLTWLPCHSRIQLQDLFPKHLRSNLCTCLQEGCTALHSWKNIYLFSDVLYMDLSFCFCYCFLWYFFLSQSCNQMSLVGLSYSSTITFARSPNGPLRWSQEEVNNKRIPFRLLMYTASIAVIIVVWLVLLLLSLGIATELQTIWHCISDLTLLWLSYTYPYCGLSCFFAAPAELY